MDNFREWYVRNQDAITWFLIGWLTFSAIDSFVKGNYGWAAFSAALVYGNYKLNTIRLK